jgi:hypothetical protein
MLRSRVKQLEQALKELERQRISDHVEDNVRRVEDWKRLEQRVKALEDRLSELTGNSPGMWSQVAKLRKELDELIKATGCERVTVPYKPSEPEHTAIRKVPRIRS